MGCQDDHLHGSSNASKSASKIWRIRIIDGRIFECQPVLLPFYCKLHKGTHFYLICPVFALPSQSMHLRHLSSVRPKVIRCVGHIPGSPFFIAVISSFAFPLSKISCATPSVETLELVLNWLFYQIHESLLPLLDRENKEKLKKKNNIQ